LKATRIEIDNIEAIYINPRWKKSKVGDYLTTTVTDKDKKKINETKVHRKEQEALRKNQRGKKKMKLEDDGEEKSDSSDDDEKSAAARREAMSQGSGLTIEEFKKLKIPDSVMKDGMIFIWVEKEFIYHVTLHLETQGF